MPQVRSLAQLGLRLHVLVDREVADAPGLVRDRLSKAGLEAQVEKTRANLEDVFVAATLPTDKKPSIAGRLGAEREREGSGERNAAMNAFVATFARIKAVAFKEFLQLRRDRLTGGMIVGIPLIQILIFGYGINMDVRHIRAGVVDEANTSLSRSLVSQLEASQVVHFTERATNIRELRTTHERGSDLGRPLHPRRLRAPRAWESMGQNAGTTRPFAQLLIDGSEPGVEGALEGARDVAPASATRRRAPASAPPRNTHGIQPRAPHGCADRAGAHRGDPVHDHGGIHGHLAGARAGTGQPRAPDHHAGEVGRADDRQAGAVRRGGAHPDHPDPA